MTLARSALALTAALLTAGCSRDPSPAGPAPVAMVPSEGTGLAALPVVIVGDHFDATGSTDFASGSGTLAAGFQARLLPDAGGAAVALTSVRLTPDKRLEAVVPAAIGRGGYALEVTDPAGRTGLLHQAFRVYAAASTIASFRVVPAEPATAGVPFRLDLTAVDAGGLVVEGFSGQVTLSDLTGKLSPTTAGPFTLGRASLRVAVGAVATADRITADDGLGHSGSSAVFAVAPGPPVAIAFVGAPGTLKAGTCSGLVTLEARDALGNASPVAAALTIELQSAPAGSVAFHGGGGACNAPVTSVAISGGAATATFRFTGSAPGPVQLRAAPAGLPSATASVSLVP